MRIILIQDLKKKAFVQFVFVQNMFLGIIKEDNENCL